METYTRMWQTPLPRPRRGSLLRSTSPAHGEGMEGDNERDERRPKSERQRQELCLEEQERPVQSFPTVVGSSHSHCSTASAQPSPLSCRRRFLASALATGSVGRRKVITRPGVGLGPEEELEEALAGPEG